MKQKRKSEEAARKKIEAGNSRQIAKQFCELNDFPSTDFYNWEAQRLDAEAEVLLGPTHPVVIGTGGEAVQNEPDSYVVDTLLKDPTSVSLDASSKRLDLLERIDCVAPALDASDSIVARNSFEKMLAHQMAVAHITSMDLMAEAKELRRLSSSYNAEVLSLKKMNMARMFMDFNVRALEALARIRSGGKQNITVTHKNVSVTGGQTIIADQVMAGGQAGGDE